MSAMSNNLNCGSGSPKNERSAIVETAANMFCTVCGGRPCYLLATAAMTVMQDTLREKEDLVSTARYMQNLLRVQRCLEKHLKEYLFIMQDTWGLDKHLSFTEEKINHLTTHGINVEELQAALQREIHYEGPKLITN